MTALDVFVFLLIIGGGAVGFVRGFVHEVISLFAWIVAVAMLKLFHTQLWTGLINSFHEGNQAGSSQDQPIKGQRLKDGENLIGRQTFRRQILERGMVCRRGLSRDGAPPGRYPEAGAV